MYRITEKSCGVVIKIIGIIGGVKLPASLLAYPSLHFGVAVQVTSEAFSHDIALCHYGNPIR